MTSPSHDLKVDTNRITTTTGDVFAVQVVSANPAVRARWGIGQTYSLNIDTTARDINGNYLQHGVVIRFEPEPFFRVTSTFPPNGAPGALPSSTIYIYFNNVVDTSIFSMLHVEPSISQVTCPSDLWLTLQQTQPIR